MPGTAPLTPVSTPQALEEACRRLAGAPFLAVDTEFHRERTFFAQLCLIQVASAGETVLIDPLALRSLDALRELLLSPDVVKVLHSGKQDLEIFHALWGEVPSPVFDTQVAASVLGLGHQSGYARVVEDVLGVRLEKAGTLTDWSRRPLSSDQLRYAADDVIHLAALYPVLTARLLEQGRDAWLGPEMEALTDPAQYAHDPASAWRSVRGAGTLRGPARTAIRPLAAWRDEMARSRDVPRRWVVTDEALLEIARRRPETLDDLSRIRGLSPKLLQEQGVRMIELASQRAEVEEPEAPARRRAPEADVLADLLQALVRMRARERGIAPSQLATREQLERIAAEGASAGVAVLAGWRREVVGEDLLALRAGTLQLLVEDGEVRVERVDPA